MIIKISCPFSWVSSTVMFCQSGAFQQNYCRDTFFACLIDSFVVDRVPCTTLRLLSPWLWPPSLRVCPPSSPLAWLWAPGAWPRRMPSSGLCPPWRLWAAPPSSALTRPAHSPPTRCPSPGKSDLQLAPGANLYFSNSNLLTNFNHWQTR